jgi:hypothetical protein
VEGTAVEVVDNQVEDCIGLVEGCNLVVGSVQDRPYLQHSEEIVDFP